MNKEEIFHALDRILDDWDPIGILESFKPLNYEQKGMGEYHNYIRPIIKVYLNDQSILSMRNHLIKLQTDLSDYPNEEMLHEISIASEKLVKFLSLYTESDLHKSISQE